MWVNGSRALSGLSTGLTGPGRSSGPSEPSAGRTGLTGRAGEKSLHLAAVPRYIVSPWEPSTTGAKRPRSREIEDRALAHLKVVISTKLRRGESFTLSWRHPEGQSGGRSTIWLHPSIPLRFVFDDPEPTELSRTSLKKISRTPPTRPGGSSSSPSYSTWLPVQSPLVRSALVRPAPTPSNLLLAALLLPQQAKRQAPRHRAPGEAGFRVQLA